MNRFLVFVVLLSQQAWATALKLPVIDRVGVLPVYWESALNEDLSSFSDLKGHIDKRLSSIVREAHKFRVLNDELVKLLWEHPQGRAELVEEHEIDAFVGLSVAFRGDIVVFVARLMSTDLKNLVLESETLAVERFVNLSLSACMDQLRNLFFRLFNRIPVDATVTSLQGRYLTISAGRVRSINKGDKFAIYRTEITSLHPANGSWLTFRQRPLGYARVVESKDFTAVAKILEQNYPGAVEVGDGVKIEGMDARNYFAEVEQQPEFVDSGAPLIVDPLYTSADLKKEDKPPVDFKEVERNEFKLPKPTMQPPTKPGADAEHEPWKGYFAKVADYLVLHAGTYQWSVRGPAQSESKFPIWLVNTIGGRFTRQMWEKIHLGIGGSLGAGGTKAGGSFGFYDGHTRIFWQDALDVLPGVVSGWRAGGHASFSGLGVSGERFGGGDWLMGGMFAAIDGQALINPVSMQPDWDWFAEFTLTPLTFGRYGYGGRRRTIKSSLAWRVDLGFIQNIDRSFLEWGGGFSYEGRSMFLENNKEASVKAYSLKLLARWRY